MASSITLMASSSTSRLLSKKTHLPIPLPKPSLSLPHLPKPSLSLPPTLTVAAASIAAAAAASSPLPALAAEIEEAALFDFNLTLPAIAVEFLLLMVSLDKIYFTPLGKFTDERDAAIRAKLGGGNSVMAFKGTLQFLVAMGDRFERERARYNEFFQIFMDFKDVDKRVDGDEIIRRTELLFDGEEIMVMGFYYLMLDTNRKSRKPDDLGEVFNRVLEMIIESAVYLCKSDGRFFYYAINPRRPKMHQNQDCNPERNITQENQNSQAEINESSMTGLYKNKVRSEKKRKRNNSKDSASTLMDDTSRKCGSSSNKETPSYKLLHEPTSLRSSNSPELNELNDSCYLAVKCNRNTIRKINEYEQTLFDCEDDMFELDMLVERVKATTRKLEGEIEKNSDGQNFIKLIKLESTTNFNSSNLRCLLNFYNYGVTKIMDLIGEDPATELQRIYEDMKHWAEVLLELREEVHKICKDVFAENYPKMYNGGQVSLKHRSSDISSRKSRLLSF